jgi:hypothetical protein
LINLDARVVFFILKKIDENLEEAVASVASMVELYGPELVPSLSSFILNIPPA